MIAHERKRVPELMDDPDLDYESHVEALRGLEKLNRVSNTADSLWCEIKKLRAHALSRPLRILDIATGGGDNAIALYLLAQSENFPIHITACDLSIDAIKYAAEKAKQNGAVIDFVAMNALEALPQGFDVIMTSLFTHHLDPPDVVRLLGNMKQSAGRLVLVNDLVRSDLAYALVWIATRIFSQSKIVQYDGPVSVNASFTAVEFKAMAEEAGLLDCVIKSCPPCRQLLIWSANKGQ